MTKKKPCEQGFPLENQLVMLQNSGDLEFADEVTLGRALEARREL